MTTLWRRNTFYKCPPHVQIAVPKKKLPPGTGWKTVVLWDSRIKAILQDVLENNVISGFSYKTGIRWILKSIRKHTDNIVQSR